MKHLFIDSNIWLSLYHFTNDDLSQFRRLKDLIDGDINLLIPTQVCDEVIRNRDSKIKEMLKDFKTFTIKFPAFAKNYAEYDSFFNQYKELQTRHRDWIIKIEEDIETHNLPADIVINDFFNSVQLLDCSEEIIRLAELRFKSGNPPGKDNKYGDAINWECLLKNVEPNNDLYLVSADKDYSSVISESRLNNFLLQEWKGKKNAEVYFFSSLTSFLDIHINQIRLETESKKEELISHLIDSHSFNETHLLIEKLNQYSDWTPIQIEKLLMAAYNNFQVSYIIRDEDVLSFYSKILKNANDDQSYKEEVEKMLQERE